MFGRFRDLQSSIFYPRLVSSKISEILTASVSERPASTGRGLAITQWTEAVAHLKSSRLSERGLIS